MRDTVIIGSENSVRSVFDTRNTMPRGNPGSVADVKIEAPEPPPRKSEEQMLAEHYDRAAQGWLDRDDINKDGLLSKDEFLAGKKIQAEADKTFFDLDAEEQRWAELDPEGKGAIGKDEIIAGLKAFMPLAVHHLDPDVAKRMIAMAEEAAEQSKQDLQAGLKAESGKPSIARNIESMIAEQASGLSLFGEDE